MIRKNIEISEDTKVTLSIMAAKRNILLKPFIERELMAMAMMGISFTECIALTNLTLDQIQTLKTQKLNHD